MVSGVPSGAPIASITPAAANRVNSIWLGWFQAMLAAVNTVVSYAGASILVPTTGFNLTLTGATQITTLNPATTLATGTLTMPASPYDGQVVQVSTTHTITALTLNANVGQTIKNAPTTLAAGTSFMYYWNALTTTWFRLQ